MTRIGLVACSSSKLDHPAPARELYTSQLFRKSVAYAEATCERWYVLSALHHLVRPDEVLEPYDFRLAPPGGGYSRSWAQACRWGERVKHELSRELVDVDEPYLVILAGRAYRDGLVWRSTYRWEAPMAGLAIGQQLAWLTRELSQLERKAS